MNRLFDIVRVAGPDARSFLQGQLTQDLARLDDHPSLPAAWCNPKGRVIAVMRIIEAREGSDETFLSVPAGMADALVKRLLMFRFRARVDISLAGSEWEAFAVSDEKDIAALDELGLLRRGGAVSAARIAGLVAVDTGAPSRCIEVYGLVAAMQEAGVVVSRPLPDAEWQLALINAGMPTIDTATTEKYTPHMLNLDCLGAISFTKGCYTGQEVVARTQHLGKSKRRLMHYRTEEPLANIGDKLRRDDREAGEVLNAAGADLLAVVAVGLRGLTLSLEGHPATPVDLPYALPE